MAEKRKRKKRRRWLWIVVGVAALAVIGGCGLCVVGTVVGPGSPSMDGGEVSTPSVAKPTVVREEMTSMPPVVKPTAVEEWEGVTIGMPADDVLVIHPKSETIAEPEIIGQDEEGMIVKWSYPEADLIMARWEKDGVYCYRVREILLK